VQAVGCFKDGDDRALPDQIINSRDAGSKVFMGPNLDDHWKNYPRFLSNFICE